MVPFACRACASANTTLPADTVARATSSLGGLSETTPPRAEPVALLKLAQERYERGVHDYRCVFVKQERIDGELRPKQVMHVLYRTTPQSVSMIWVQNADRVRRCLYVKGRNLNDKGDELAIVEPAGALARLLVPRARIPIHGEQARETSRRPIDQFGFHSILQRLNQDNERYARRGVLEWRYEGQGAIDTRPTLMLVRELTRPAPDGRSLDARIVIHLDQEWLLPVGVYSYADMEEQTLLGSYVMIDVELNRGLPDSAFVF
jgi:hypothetical protein